MNTRKENRMLMQEEKIMANAVLCFLRKESKVLLARKTKKIGMNKWNGYGGEIERGETPEAAMVRELGEEAGVSVVPSALTKIAVVDFTNTKLDGGDFVVRVHVFEIWDWVGTPESTEEMDTPTWYPVDALPFHQMMPADPVWLPVALSGKKIVATAHYTPLQQALVGEVVLSDVEDFL